MRGRIAFAILAVVALIGVGSALFVSAPSGQRFLTDRILRAIGGTDQTIAVKDIGGDWPSRIIWTGITVADREGIWLTLDRLEVELNLAALFIGRLDADSAEVGTAHMLRQPVGGPNPQPSAPPSVDGLIRALSPITVRDARVGTVRVDPPVAGRAIDATLSGSLEDDPDSGLHTLTLTGNLQTEPGSLTVRLAGGRNAAVLHINGAAERFRAIGAIAINNRSNALSGALKLSCRDETVCYAGSSHRIGAVDADLVVAGTVAAPRGTFNFSAHDLGYAERRLPRLEGRISVAPMEAMSGAIDISGEGRAAGLPGALPEGSPLVGDEVSWSFSLTRAGDGALTLNSARVATGEVALQVSDLRVSPLQMPLTLRLSATGIGRLLGLEDSVSATQATLRIDQWEEGRGDGHLMSVTTGLPQEAAIPPLLEARLNLAADIAVTSDRVAFGNIVAESNGAAVRGTSAWIREPRFDHAASALTVTLAPRGALIPEPTQGDVTLSGALESLHAEISATAAAVLLSRAPIFDVVISATLDRTAAGFQAAVEGNGQWIDGSLGFSASVSQSKLGTIAIDGISWRSPTVDFSGDLSLDAATGLLSGELGGPITDLAPLTAAFGASSAGTADIAAIFSPGDGQKLDVTFSGNSVRNDAFSAGRLMLKTALKNLWGEARISASGEAQGARLLDRPLSAFVARADGSLAALNVEVDAKGSGAVPFAISALADIVFDNATNVSLRRFAIRDGDIEAALLDPTDFSMGRDSLTLAPTRLAVQGGEVEGTFTWNRTNDYFDGALKAANVALPTFTGLPGQSAVIVVSGDAKFSGPAGAVNGDLRLTGTLPATENQPAILVEAVAALADGRAEVEATANGLSDQPARLLADIPARLDLASAKFSVSTSEPVSGSLKWTGNLTPLWRIVPVDEDVLAGDVVIDASLSGTLEAPVFGGSFNLTRGTYENLVGGTVLRNIEASIGGDGQNGFTISAKAQDMNNGSVTVAGRIAGDGRMTADINADLVRLDVVHRDDVVAAVSGKLSYTGPVGGAVLKGNVQMVRSLVRLGGSYVPEIPLLRPLPGFEPAGNDGLLNQVGLEVSVATADPIRIEGQGLDSVWRGQLNVAGTVAQPDVRGTLTLDRGSFSFLGQTFTLDRGTVAFTGGGSIDPQLNIVAVRETSDITATVTIAGRARAPDVQLTSRPSLPRDEILARLLFRKGTGELGPIESTQLASAASDLAGIAQGGINGVLRRTLGIDLTSGAEGDSVVVGRQFGRNLYVSVGQSLTEQEREIVVEWRLSRSISVKSTTSDVTGADIGVFWRKDY